MHKILNLKEFLKSSNIDIGNNKTFIVAEIGSNHNHDLNIAKRLIGFASNAGADAVKFQSISLNELYDNPNKSIRELYKKIELQKSFFEKIFNYCKNKNILCFSSPTYLKAIDYLEELDVKLYKIASPQTATFPQLIERIARTNKPTIMSTGYCNEYEIARAVRVFKKYNQNLALLHCISEYPTDYKLANLNFIKILKEQHHIPVGFSDHSLGIELSIAAVAMNANIIEKHITLSRNMVGPDHHFALEPSEFKNMIRAIRNIEFAKGNIIKTPTYKELDTINYLRMKTKNGKIFKRDINGINAWALYPFKK